MKRFLWALSGIIATVLLVFNSGSSASATDARILIDNQTITSLSVVPIGFKFNNTNYHPFDSAFSLGISTNSYTDDGIYGYKDLYIGLQSPVSVDTNTRFTFSYSLYSVSAPSCPTGYTSWFSSAPPSVVDSCTVSSATPSVVPSGSSFVSTSPNYTVVVEGHFLVNSSIDHIFLSGTLAYFSNKLFNVIISTSRVSFYKINDVASAVDNAANQAHSDAEAQLAEQQKANQIAEEQKNFVTDTSTPEAGDIANSDSLPSVGLLPPGPLDSILLLPVNILNSIIQSFGGNCSPVVAPLPFVGENLTFPCFSDTFYTGSMAPLATLLGGVASAFILYKYFKHLYKKVDRAVSLETTDEDEWGIL